MAGLAALPASNADCIKAIQGYLTKILKPKDSSKAIEGMKALLLDRETKSLVSMVYSMSDILAKEGACRV